MVKNPVKLVNPVDFINFQTETNLFCNKKPAEAVSSAGS